LGLQEVVASRDPDTVSPDTDAPLIVPENG